MDKKFKSKLTLIIKHHGKEKEKETKKNMKSRILIVVFNGQTDEQIFLSVGWRLVRFPDSLAHVQGGGWGT